MRRSEEREDDPFDLPPVILCYKLNNQWLTSKRGGPVRMIVPADRKAKGFHLTGGHGLKDMVRDFRPRGVDEELLNGTVTLQDYQESVDFNTGVLFDIGHGKGSFGFVTAEAMLAAGFEPDCISSDVHILSEHGPAYDQLVTMSKLMHVGMPFERVVAASTDGPAGGCSEADVGGRSADGPTGCSTGSRWQ